jgi:hypothetical protein
MTIATEASGKNDAANLVSGVSRTSETHAVHTSEVFTFVANARIDDVFPLFGAYRERLWAPDW